MAVGKDVSLISFDYLEFGLYLHPQPTAVNMPDRHMGRLAIERLLGLKDSQHKTTKVDCELMLSQSHLLG